MFLVRKMVVYADILIFLNTVINYFLIVLTSKFGNNYTKTIRHALGAFVGAIFALNIFLPYQNILIEILIKIICSLVTIIIAFGFVNSKKYMRNVIIFFSISFIYAGAMLGVWTVFKPKGMIIKNSVVYFNISPTLLIFFSFIFYIIIVVLRKIFSYKTSDNRLCDIKIKCINNTLETTALIDSGHNLKDFISDKEIIFLSKNKSKILFGDLKLETLNENLKKRYRSIPCQTVTDIALLTGFRCDNIFIYYNNKTYTIKSPIVVITETINHNDYSAIISPKLIERC